jgi:hypothetical protein
MQVVSSVRVMTKNISLSSSVGVEMCFKLTRCTSEISAVPGNRIPSAALDIPRILPDTLTPCSADSSLFGKAVKADKRR